MEKRKRLRRLLREGPILVVPGSYDVLTARLVQDAGFSAVYMTGSGVSLSSLGVPDLGLISYAEVLDRLEKIAAAVDIPLIADGDTGYGGVLSVIRTVKGYEARGASAMHIEDQKDPKRCGHELGRRLIKTEEMVGKIKAALDARTDADFVIIARTDARTVEGIDRAIERGLKYQEAGADVIFVESPESVEEMRRIAGSFRGPAMANMVEGGRTPFLPYPELEKLGYRLAIYPNSLTRLFCKVGKDLLTELKQNGSTQAFQDKMLTHGELWRLFDSERWAELEKRYIPANVP